jgi:small subunit ribosomal protein S17
MVTKEKIGIVVSDKMEKTISVAVEFKYRHPMYSKIVVKTKRYMAHDELGECKVGDQVLLQETRPMSKNKRWTVKQILRKSVIS